MRAKTKDFDDPFLIGPCRDCSWKVSKFVHFVDRFIRSIGKDEINPLDVRCGVGLILKQISSYIEGRYGVRVNGLVLDPSHGARDVSVCFENFDRHRILGALKYKDE